MKHACSYQVKILNCNKVLKPTISIYRSVVGFLVPIVNEEYPNFMTFKSKEQNNYLEKCLHKTKKNPHPKYTSFDETFYKLPSYLRRNAIQDALGIVKSYRSNLSLWESERYKAISSGQRFNKKAPSLKAKHFVCPVLYHKNMFLRVTDELVKIKIYHNRDWIWLTVQLRRQDIKYLKKQCSDLKASAPTLVKNKGKYYLRFIYIRQVIFSDVNLEDKRILGVDLGINKDAVCSVLDYNGTVTGRKFINSPVEKDRLLRLCNKLKEVQRVSGINSKLIRIWDKINNLNKAIINHTVHEIMTYAVEKKIDVIVFEYLDFKGKKKGALKKTQLWAKRLIQEKVTHKAHAYGIRVERVNAVNTSKLAFDGSGIVKRDPLNHSLCIFKNKKRYNTDSSASYNIGRSL